MERKQDENVNMLTKWLQSLDTKIPEMEKDHNDQISKLNDQLKMVDVHIKNYFPEFETKITDNLEKHTVEIDLLNNKKHEME